MHALVELAMNKRFQKLLLHLQAAAILGLPTVVENSATHALILAHCLFTKVWAGLSKTLYFNFDHCDDFTKILVF